MYTQLNPTAGCENALGHHTLALMSSQRPHSANVVVVTKLKELHTPRPASGARSIVFYKIVTQASLTA
jgi:hypothetical protein